MNETHRVESAPDLLYPEPETGAAVLEILGSGPDGDRILRIRERLEIGRLDPGHHAKPNRLLLTDPTISRFHCVLRREDDGGWILRDASRNGTRLDGRRLVPGIETSIRPGQIIKVGNDWEFRFLAETPAGEFEDEPEAGTFIRAETREVTVLVGDLRNYTKMVNTMESGLLERQVARLFSRLSRHVSEFGGTPKEYQGDAVLAFWEDEPLPHAADACRAALSLDALIEELRAEWSVPGFALEFDWALASGPVTLHGLGEDHRLGLSMIGEPVVLAYRLEKLADDETGRILVDEETVRRAGPGFRFRGLGNRELPGFPGGRPVFRLLGEEDPA